MTTGNASNDNRTGIQTHSGCDGFLAVCRCGTAAGRLACPKSWCQDHASRALELFQLVSENRNDGLNAHLGGLDLSAFCDAAEKISTNSNSIIDDSDDRLTAALTLYLFSKDVG